MTTRLTPPKGTTYTPPHFSDRSLKNCIGRWRNAAVLVVGMLVAGTMEARADSKPTCLGVSLPAGSKKPEGVDAKECRFISSINYDETIKFFEKGLPSSSTRWHREVNIPAAKYRHVENTATKSTWEGINIYAPSSAPNGEVYMFVIPKAQEPKKASASKDSKKSDKKDKKDKNEKKKSK